MSDPRASILDNDPFTKKNEGVRPFNPRKGPKNVSETPIFQRFWEISMNQPEVNHKGKLWHLSKTEKQHL